MINVADGNDMEQLRKAFAEAKTVKGMPDSHRNEDFKRKGCFLYGKSGRLARKSSK